MVCKDRILVNLDHAWGYYDEALKVAEKVGCVDQILMKGSKPMAEVEAKLASHEKNFHLDHQFQLYASFDER